MGSKAKMSVSVVRGCFVVVYGQEQVGERTMCKQRPHCWMCQSAKLNQVRIKVSTLGMFVRICNTSIFRHQVPVSMCPRNNSSRVPVIENFSLGTGDLVGQLGPRNLFP